MRSVFLPNKNGNVMVSHAVAMYLKYEKCHQYILNVLHGSISGIVRIKIRVTLLRH